MAHLAAAAPPLAVAPQGVAGQCSADYAAATVRILLPSSSFGTTGSAARDTFLNAFEQQIAAAIAVGMPASRVVITRIRVADGLVDFELWRAAVNSTSPAHIRDMSVVVMVQRLVAAFGNSTSVLYAAASSVTKHLDPATPPQVRSHVLLLDTSVTRRATVVLNPDTACGGPAVRVRHQATAPGPRCLALRGATARCAHHVVGNG